MISVICVFNDPKLLEGRLRRGLHAQTVEYQFIGVDNQDSRFQGGAEALNWGARQATGEWLVFAHQDVMFLTPDWLERVEALLNRENPQGWAGVAGRTRAGEFRGFLKDHVSLFGEPFEGLVEVQTLDECVLIHRRRSDDFEYFDSGLQGWHCYGVEACCAALRAGHRNYAISVPTWHDTRSINTKGIDEARAYVWRKHGQVLRRISTTIGIMPLESDWVNGRRSALLGVRLRRRLFITVGRLFGLRDLQVGFFSEAIEKLTAGVPFVETLHQSVECEDIETGAFHQLPRQTRRVIHHFGGLEIEGRPADCIVLAPDLVANHDVNRDTIERIQLSGKRFLLCLYVRDLLRRPGLWRHLFAQATDRVLALQWNGTPPTVAIFEFAPRGSNRPDHGFGESQTPPDGATTTHR